MAEESHFGRRCHGQMLGAGRILWDRLAPYTCGKETWLGSGSGELPARPISPIGVGGPKIARFHFKFLTGDQVREAGGNVEWFKSPSP